MLSFYVFYNPNIEIDSCYFRNSNFCQNHKFISFIQMHSKVFILHLEPNENEIDCC